MTRLTCPALLSALLLLACGDDGGGDGGGGGNTRRLYLALLDSELTIQLVENEPQPF
jgi:hypothetical protein